MKLAKGWSKQKRTITFKRATYNPSELMISRYNVSQGERWDSGWDERLSDYFNQITKPGTYVVSFEAYELYGSDAIRKVKITKKRK